MCPSGEQNCSQNSLETPRSAFGFPSLSCPLSCSRTGAKDIRTGSSTNVTIRTKIQTFLKATKKVQIKKKAMSTYLREIEQIQQNTNSKIMTKLAPNISHVTNTTGLHALSKRKRLSTQLARQASPGAAQLTACELPCRPRSTPTGNPVQGAHGQSPDPARIISISQFLFWSSVGERAKGRRHRSKDEGQGPGKEQP